MLPKDKIHVNIQLVDDWCPLGNVQQHVRSVWGVYLLGQIYNLHDSTSVVFFELYYLTHITLNCELREARVWSSFLVHYFEITTSIFSDFVWEQRFFGCVCGWLVAAKDVEERTCHAPSMRHIFRVQHMHSKIWYAIGKIEPMIQLNCACVIPRSSKPYPSLSQ